MTQDPSSGAVYVVDASGALRHVASGAVMTTCEYCYTGFVAWQGTAGCAIGAELTATSLSECPYSSNGTCVGATPTPTPTPGPCVESLCQQNCSQVGLSGACVGGRCVCGTTTTTITPIPCIDSLCQQDCSQEGLPGRCIGGLCECGASYAVPFEREANWPGYYPQESPYERSDSRQSSVVGGERLYAAPLGWPEFVPLPRPYDRSEGLPSTPLGSRV
jgi:hypothetical protein